MCGQVVEQFPLAAPDPFRAAEALEMGASDVGQDAVVGFGDRGQTGDLAAGAGSHLDDPEFGVGSHGEQRERHADVVVEVAPGGVEGEAAAENAARELLGRGLAVAACDGEDRDAQRAAVGAGQLLQGAERIIDDEHPCIRARCRRVVGDGPCGPLGKGLVHEAVAVERGAAQREEDRPGLDAARVGRDARVAAEKRVEVRYACRHCGTSLRR